MIKGPENSRLPTINNADARIAMNWTRGVEGKFLKISVNGEEAIVPFQSFMQFALIAADESTQEKLIPMKLTTRRIYKKTVHLKLRKPMKAGEDLFFPVEFEVPHEEVMTNKFIS